MLILEAFLFEVGQDAPGVVGRNGVGLHDREGSGHWEIGAR